MSADEVRSLVASERLRLARLLASRYFSDSRGPEELAADVAAGRLPDVSRMSPAALHDAMVEAGLAPDPRLAGAPDLRLALAREVWAGRANGGFQGVDASKGGRAWIDGEFQLDELEALCAIVRDHAGPFAQGLDELEAPPPGGEGG